MKKTLRKILTAFVLACVAFSACACGTLIKNDPNSKVIVVSIYNGGLGTDWFTPIEEEFEKDYPGYDVQVEKLKRTVSEIDQLIALGQQADMYFSTVPDFHHQIYADNLEDLSDVLQMKPDGEDGLTVAQKVTDLETWQAVASKNGEGIYMLPYDDLILGINYDHEEFVEKNLLYTAAADDATKTALTNQQIQFKEEGGRLLFVSSAEPVNYEENDVILRAGKDGKYGTYDDGQPVTMDEWNTLVNRLKGVGENAKPFIYSGQIVDYTTDVFNGIFAQYDGLDAWKTFNTYEGSYTFPGDSQPTPIHMETGYKVFGMEGIHKATEFLQTYLNNHDYVSDEAFQSEVSHTDAQGRFILGGAKENTTAPFVGMLVDGSWWEREANGIFRDLSADSRYADYAYGNRDYRIMLYPDMVGQKGVKTVDGVGHGTVFSARSTGACIIPKQDNADIVEKSKILLSYTLKDKWLRHFTVETGGIRPYNYDLTEEDKSQLSKYAQNVWELYHDTENIGIVRPNLDRYVTPLPYMTSKGNLVNWMCNVNGIPYNMPINALKQAINSGQTAAQAIETVFAGFEDYFSGVWSGYVGELG